MKPQLKQLSVYFILMLTSYGLHAESCQLVNESSGVLTVQCRGITYKAVTEASLNELLEEDKKNREEIKQLNQRLKETTALVENQQDLNNRYRGLSENYMNLNSKFERSLDKSIGIGDRLKKESLSLIKLTERYDQLVNDYDELVEKYRKIALSGSSAIAFDLGIGMTSNNGDTEPVGLVGMSISSYHVWGIMQTDNSGVLFGKSFDF